jgi:MlaC protein
VWEFQPLTRFVKDVRSVDPDVLGTPVMNFEFIRGIQEAYEQAGLYAFVGTVLLVLGPDDPCRPEANGQLPVEYWLVHKGQRWAVFDVIVEGVSLARNYRAQFDQIIQSSSYDTLLQRVKRKVAEEPS